VAGLKALAEHFGLFDHRKEARRRAAEPRVDEPRVAELAEALT
jgi:hypothetical protein